jgi:D-alanyl-D-alanine dipeptidase
MLIAASLPNEAGAQQPVSAPPTTLVNVRSADSTIRVVDPPPILVHRDVAEGLARVARRLATGAVGLKVFSGYRSVPGPHAEGLAVDLTLVDLSRGTEIPMGTVYPGSDSVMVPAPPGGREARYRELLRRVMTEEGFVADETRWWHYQLQPLAASH